MLSGKVAIVTGGSRGIGRAVSIALAVSNRLQPVAAAFLCLMAMQLAVASCTPEPAPYAARAPSLSEAVFAASSSAAS